MNRLAQYCRERGVTRTEVLASLLALSLVVTVTAGMTRAEPAKAAACHNNLRQLGRALLCYADDNAGTFPPRSPYPYWPGRLQPYLKELSTLACPSDGENPRTITCCSTNAADTAPRSYLLNAWSDYFSVRYGQVRFGWTNGLPESAIREPAQTILFGEKAEDSIHYWFDLEFEGDIFQTEMGRHFRTGDNSSSGASNHAFADGSVRLLKWGQAFDPITLWAIEPDFRGPWPPAP